jgi:alpha-glucoside transport system substrate-binding protein
MPAAVGAGQEWKSFVTWFSNPDTPVKTIADQVDAAWPAS